MRGSSLLATLLGWGPAFVAVDPWVCEDPNAPEVVPRPESTRGSSLLAMFEECGPALVEPP